MGKVRERQLRLYEKMLRIRIVEEHLGRLFAGNAIPGFIHLSIGQEAVAAGIAEAIEPGDTFSTTHRGHGHAIANGIDLRAFLAEIMGKETGLCRGRSGSMHVADLSIGMLGANGIVGGGIPITLGSAFAHQYQQNQRVAITFFGDGALAEGVLHESLNIASLWSLPVVFVCENNGWSEFSRASDQLAFESTRLAASYGIDAVTVDGNDVEKVAAMAERKIRLVRAGGGPCFIECITTRHKGHFEGDPQKYREQDEIEKSRDNDPLSRLANRIDQPEQLAALQQKISAEVESIIAAVSKQPQEAFAEALSRVYAA